MILSILTICNVPIRLSAQCFLAPNNHEHGSTCQYLPANVSHTGNDSRYALWYTTGGVPRSIEVSVCDGTYPSLIWREYTTPSHGCLPLPQYIQDPDVALVAGQYFVYVSPSQPYVGVDTWFAIVVYADGNNNCICDVYYWVGGTFAQYTSSVYPYTSVFPYTLQACSNAATYNNTINVDADQLGNFCIVWDDLGESDIIAQGGVCTSTSDPSLVGKAVVANGSNFIMPDISLTKRTCTSGCRSEAYCTYIDASQNILHVDGGYFEDWIVSNTCTTYNLHPVYFTANLPGTSSNTATYLYPRIACATYNSTGSWNLWAVVVELYDPSNSNGWVDDIIGYTNVNGTNPIIYTDGGTNSPCAIDAYSNERNQFPVVTYDVTYNGMMVGWQSDYSPDILHPTGLAALICHTDGTWDNSCGNNYLIVSYDNSTSTHNETSLSLSGRDWTDIQYTFYNENNNPTPDILDKYDYFSTCALRMRKNNDEKYISVFPNPFSDNINISLSGFGEAILSATICNLTGEILFNISGSETDINKSVNLLSAKFPQGIYILNVRSDITGETINQKLIKM